MILYRAERASESILAMGLGGGVIRSAGGDNPDIMEEN